MMRKAAMTTVRGTLPLIAAAFMSLSGPAQAQSALEPRMPGFKQTVTEMLALPASRNVVVKFREGSRVRMKSGRLTGLATADATAFVATLRVKGISAGAARRLHGRSEADLDQERLEGERDSGRQLADQNLYYVIDLPTGVNAASLADALNRLSIVEFAEPGPVAAPPPADIPPRTPLMRVKQGYLNAPPQGIGVLDPVRYQGSNGATLNVTAIEYSWQLNHEDLELPATRIITGGATLSDPFTNTDHGTAVLGEIVAKKNAYGVTGIAPAAVAFVAPVNTAQFGYNPARAISLATARMRRGDAILIEQHTQVCGLPGDSFGPLEWLQPVFDAVSAATAKGVIVLAVAGNANINLDRASCLGRFNRTVRNSRAIIVGAGDPATHARLSFSNYGSRLDVQGWGVSVATTGYGDTFNPGDIRQRYTEFFAGTSSATAIVTGAVLSIQGVVKACGLALLSPLQMRIAMATTGTPQANPGTGRIGPLPRIRQALLATPARACVLAASPSVSAVASE